jgi:hypothetical protein
VSDGVIPQISRGNVIRVCGYKMALFIRHARSHGSDDYADVIGSDGKLHLVNYNDIEWMQPDGSLVHDSSVPMFNVRD